MNAVRTVDIGPAKLLLGDAYKIRPSLGFVDGEIMDPPYVIKTSGAGKFRKARPYLDQIAELGIDEGFDKTIINPMLTGSVCVFCHNDQVPELSSYLNGTFDRFVLGFWGKTNPMPVANKHLVPDAEIWIRSWNAGYHPVGELADKRRILRAEGDDTDEWPILGIMERVHPSKTFGHPTVKPLAVMDTIVRTTNGETILDPFMGTGSTGVSALRAGKRFIGIEMNPRFFDIAIERITEELTRLDAAA